MRVTALNSYPVKSCYRVAHWDVTVQPWGFADDRRWLVLDADGKMLTQREEPAMVRIKPVADGDTLHLTSIGHPDLTVESTAGDLVDMRLFSNPLRLSPVGEAADAWLSVVLDRKVRLMWLDDPRRRPVNPDYSRPDDRVNLADAFPVGLGNTASLNALNDLLLEAGSDEGPIPMTRFRPNIEIAGAAPWAEDDWVGGRIRIGDVVFQAPKGIARCVITTTDQDTGVRGHEPLRTLGRHRNVNQGLLFCLALIPEAAGRISVGDTVTVV
jgi:uncharacterized protein